MPHDDEPAKCIIARNYGHGEILKTVGTATWSATQEARSRAIIRKMRKIPVTGYMVPGR